MRRFLVVAERAGRNSSAYLPDLPGSVATGATPDETMASLRAAIDMHVQGLREDRLPVPEPSAIAEYVEIGPLARPRHRMVSIRGVETLGGFRVRLSLTDGSSREVDLGPYLTGPVFEPVRNDAAFFRSVRVDEELGTIVWPNGADIDPDVLILGRTPASFETASSGSRAG